jgi:hypothetical protein
MYYADYFYLSVEEKKTAKRKCQSLRDVGVVVC